MMRIQFENERVLAVVAHPDDAEMLCAGTLARAKADGAATGIVVLCQGDKGQPDRPIENLGQVRSQEMIAAANIIGAELFFGKFGDGELYDSPKARLTLIEFLRQFRPTLVLAHSKNDYHSDHQAASSVTEAASWFCTSAAHKTKSQALVRPPQLWLMDTVEMMGFVPHFYIDVSPYLETKREMLACHKSQLQRGDQGSLSPLDELLQRQCKARGAQAGVEAAEAFCNHHTWKRSRAW